MGRKTRNRSYSTHIYKVLKQVHPDIGISNKAMSIMNDFVKDMLNKIAATAGHLAEVNQRRTMTSREIQSAVRLELPGELAKHGVSEGTKAVTKHHYDSASSGLQFPVPTVRRHLKEKHYTNRISKTASVYLAAVLEYLAAEVLELAGNVARDNKKIRIVPRHIYLAFYNDEELNKFLQKVTIASGGNNPTIHAALLSYMKRVNLGGEGEGEGEAEEVEGDNQDF